LLSSRWPRRLDHRAQTRRRGKTCWWSRRAIASAAARSTISSLGRAPARHHREIGGQWVGPTQDRVLALIQELGLETFKTYDIGNYVDYRNGLLLQYGHIFRRTRLTSASTDPPTDPAGAAEAGVRDPAAQHDAAQVPLDAPWTAPSAVAWTARPSTAGWS